MKRYLTYDDEIRAIRAMRKLAHVTNDPCDATHAATPG